MIWNFLCPVCRYPHWTPWENNGAFLNCPNIRATFRVPTPREQPSAFVSGRHAPTDMLHAVIAVKGMTCTVPNCNLQAEVVDHRVPYVRNGRTSLENLWPMCRAHNASKGDEDYPSWLVCELRRRHLAKLVIRPHYPFLAAYAAGIQAERTIAFNNQYPALVRFAVGSNRPIPTPTVFPV